MFNVYGMYKTKAITKTNFLFIHTLAIITITIIIFTTFQLEITKHNLNIIINYWE